MAILGNGGTLELSRATPLPMAMSIARLNLTSILTVSLTNQDYWTGDHVVIASSKGVFFNANNDSYGDCPDGHAIYSGGKWSRGPSRSFYTGSDTDTSQFYDQSSGADLNDWYNTNSTTGLTTTFDAYIYRDELDRLLFFSTESEAHRGDSSDRIRLRKVDCGNFIIAPYNSNAGYIDALNSAAQSLSAVTLTSPEQPLRQAITVPSLLEEACETDPIWLVQSDLKEWALSIDSANLDTTSIGETFGEHVKAVVRGAGTLDFLVDHRDNGSELDAMTLLRLVLMTERQCNTKAKFYLYKDRSGVGTQNHGSAYYECDLLLTNTKVNTRATAIIAGSADFVATSEIKLKVESNQ